MNRSNIQGFTLLELMLVIVILSIAASASTGMINQIAGFYMAEQDLINESELRSIADAHIKYSALHNRGQLIGSYSGGDCNACPINTTIGELTNYVENRGQRTASLSNYDTTSVLNVRGLMLDANTYQATFSVPAAVNMVLEYKAGVIVQTDCPKGSTCDTGESWATPAYVQTGWVPNARITKSVPYNNLESMQTLASGTVERVVYVQQKIREYTQEMVISNPANLDVNYLPVPNLPSTPDRSGTDPTGNGGCINGWWDLGSASVNLLDIVGLEQSYGTTLFGGSVQYCADFDLTAVDASAADTAPHVGAIRINRFVTRGSAPSSNNNDNVIFPI